MRRIIFLLSLTSAISCTAPDGVSSGNYGPLYGNSDKKIHNSSESKDHSKNNVFKYDPSKVKFNFTAYKLPGANKTGVNGTFKTINVSGAKETDAIENVMSNTTFSIPVNTLSTNDTDRDGKIVKFFFGNLIESDTITGSFGAFENNIIPVKLNLNNMEVTKAFSYKINDRNLTLTGTIDLIEDFSADKGLKGITEVCKDLHQGKTWPDVDIECEINF